MFCLFDLVVFAKSRRTPVSLNLAGEIPESSNLAGEIIRFVESRQRNRRSRRISLVNWKLFKLWEKDNMFMFD
ncbi:hypothetical protein DY000_02038811 [Brassica cretica]|uniref:Uncharacterized protein n=1 Tax=Brassica cretica TaxID=69181 RepID=A0ABQ7BPI1_BRACR|nr:hypothetical protein DY000_02038811 [Brassica cretica]